MSYFVDNIILYYLKNTKHKAHTITTNIGRVILGKKCFETLSKIFEKK